MRSVLFYPSLEGISVEEVAVLLNEYTGDEFIAVARDNASLAEVEFWVNPEHELDLALLDALPSLRMISLAFTGYERVDLGHLRSRGLEVYYVPDYSTNSVAELTLALTLSVLRSIPLCNKHVHDGLWHGLDPGIELHGKKVAILGTGAIGAASAKLYRAFGCDVVGWALGHEKESFRDLGFHYEDDLGKVFAESDVIALHLPVTQSTRHIVGLELLRLMKPTSLLINTSRSELVDTNALVKVLQQRPDLNAAFDVVDNEPIVDARLLELSNLLITPHRGFRTKEALRRLAKEAISNIARFQHGENANRLRA